MAYKSYNPYVPHSSTQHQFTDYYHSATPMAQSYSQDSSTSSGSNSSNTTYGSSGSTGYVHMSEVEYDPHASMQWSQAAATPPPEPEVKSKPPKLYTCLVPGCNPKTKNGAFTRAADLVRHMETVHNAAPANLDCPYAKNWCERTGTRGFSRRDHLNEHIRQVHPGKQELT